MSTHTAQKKASKAEYQRWNDRHAHKKLWRLLEANFRNDSFYYIVVLGTKGFNMDCDGVLSEFRTDIIRKLHRLVPNLKYIYTVHEAESTNEINQKYEIHIVTNAQPEQMNDVCFRFWMIENIIPKLRVHDLSIPLVAIAMTSEHVERRRLQNKRMYVPSVGLIRTPEQEGKQG